MSTKRAMTSNKTNGDSIDNSKTNLIINYLPQQMTDQDFRVLFAQIGDIRSAKIIRKKSNGYSYGFGFVDYLLPEDAERAIKSLNGHLVEHKKIKVAFARPSSDDIKQANLYIKNLPQNYSDHDIRQLFSPFGNIIQCRLVAHKGLAFVLYDLHDEALTAIDAMNGKTLPGAVAPLNVKFANDNNQKQNSKLYSSSRKTRVSGQGSSSGGSPYGSQRSYSYSHMPYEGYGSSGPMRHVSHNPREHRFNPISNNNYNSMPYQSYSDTQTPLSYDSMHPSMSQSYSMSAPPPPATYGASGTINNGYNAEKGGYILFAYNIGPETNEDNLGALFSHYGKVVRVNVIRKDSRESKGFGFVTMKNYNDALNAINALNGYNFTGKPLQVSFKK
ncbi:ELAV-like protein 1-B [Oppia nitens]|uniref:ELAV-like protein 1-B n=1 Tax=Oppia nitens TaxID=1686743 RepID=UPI0023D97DFD|nr:ELAV-like protein 1-B [Oppia nitens]